MRDEELYESILGLGKPWRVVGVELDAGDLVVARASVFAVAEQFGLSWDVIDGIMQRATTQGIELDASLVMITSRLNRMEPESDSPHLPSFKAEFPKHGRYLLLPVGKLAGGLRPAFDLAIEKKEILFRHVSEVTDDDLDSVILKPQ